MITGVSVGAVAAALGFASFVSSLGGDAAPPAAPQLAAVSTADPMAAASVPARPEVDGTVLAAADVVPIMGADAGGGARAAETVLLEPGESASVLGGAATLRLSLIAPDEAVIRIAADGGALKTAELGQPLTLATAAGACAVVFEGVDGGKARVTFTCGGASAATVSSPSAVAGSETVLLAPAVATPVLGGAATLRLSLIAPDEAVIRIAADDGGLKTAERGKPLALATAAGACTLVYEGTEAGKARVAVDCGGSSMAAAVPAAAPAAAVGPATMLLEPGVAIPVLGGSASLRLSLIAPDEEVIRIAGQDGKLKTAERGKPLMLTTGAGACAVVYEAAEAGKARVTIDCAGGAPVGPVPLPAEIAAGLIGASGLGSGLEGCTLVSVSRDGEQAILSVTCGASASPVVAAPAPVAAKAGNSPIPAPAPATTGPRELVLEPGVKTPVGDGSIIRLSLISPDEAVIRIAGADGVLKTAVRGEPLSLSAGAAECQVVYQGADGGKARVSVSCGTDRAEAPAVIPAVATPESLPLEKASIEVPEPTVASDEPATKRVSGPVTPTIGMYNVVTGERLTLDEALEDGRDTEAVATFLTTGVNIYNENPSVLKESEELFLMACSGCHGHVGEGKIGPGLNDSYWTYPANDTDVGFFNTLYGGAQGQMGPQNGHLTLDEMLRIMSWVRHFYTADPSTATWLTAEQQAAFKPWPKTHKDPNDP